MSGPDDVSVILYDGECGLCDRFVSFVIARDGKRRFRFAPLQGGYARGVLAAAGRAPDEGAPETMLVVTPAGQLLERARAVFWVLRGLGGGWAVVAWLRVLPGRLTDWGYDRVARRRFAFWGRLPACRIPSSEERSRFLDLDHGPG